MAPPAPTHVNSKQCFVTPSECNETLLLDMSDPQIIGAVDNILATSPPPSPRAEPLAFEDNTRHHRLVPRSLSTTDSSSSNSNGNTSISLDRIKSLDVTAKVKRDGINYYIINVYQHQRRRRAYSRPSATSTTITTVAPTSSLSDADAIDTKSTDRKPDYQVKHRFAAFRELKNALQRSADKHAVQCAHCRTLLAFLTHSDNQSWTVKRLVTTTASRQELLTKFLNGVLSLTSAASDASNRVDCVANSDDNNGNSNDSSDVKQLIERFLQRCDDGGSLAII